MKKRPNKTKDKSSKKKTSKKQTQKKPKKSIEKDKKEFSWTSIIVIALIAALLIPSIISLIIKSIAYLIGIGVIVFGIVFIIWLIFEKQHRKNIN